MLAVAELSYYILFVIRMMKLWLSEIRNLEYLPNMSTTDVQRNIAFNLFRASSFSLFSRDR